MISASGSNTPVRPSSGSHEVATEKDKVVDENELEKEALEAKRIMGVKIKLTARDIVK